MYKSRDWTLNLTSWFSGRMKSSESSGSGIGEGPRDFTRDLFLAPIGVLSAQPGGFDFPRRPVKLLSQRQAALRRHLAINGNLFGSGLLVRQHGENVRDKLQPRKLLVW